MKTNEVLENIKARRSVRAYTDRQVSEEDLQAILEAATFAPSGMHLETWHFTAIQNADKLAELNERIKGAFAKSDEPKLQERGHSKAYCCYYHAPTLVIVSNEPTQWMINATFVCFVNRSVDAIFAIVVVLPTPVGPIKKIYFVFLVRISIKRG